MFEKKHVFGILQHLESFIDSRFNFSYHLHYICYFPYSYGLKGLAQTDGALNPEKIPFPLRWPDISYRAPLMFTK
jgi:hypothetical protein